MRMLIFIQENQYRDTAAYKHTGRRPKGGASPFTTHPYNFSHILAHFAYDMQPESESDPRRGP